MEEFDTKIASLTYLTNPLYQQILKQQKEKENKVTTNKSDIKFYRKRITSLTKDMLKGDIPENTYIKHIYETYVNELIKYFKMIDTSDIIQKQYEADNNNNDKYLETILEDEIEINNNKEITMRSSTMNSSTMNSSTMNSSTMNNCMMRKIPNMPSLDNYVIKLNDETKEARIIPVILDVNLKEPSLKTKGVKDKTKEKPIDKPGHNMF